MGHDPEAIVWVRGTIRGLSQRQFARLVGISGGHLSEIESGQRNAPPDLLDRMAEVLGCPRGVLERKEDHHQTGEATPS